jgi:hypothetical protein
MSRRWRQTQDSYGSPVFLRTQQRQEIVAMHTESSPRLAKLVGLPLFASVLATFALLAAVPSAQQVPARSQVTFTKDVAPILQKSCQNCHRPRSVGPMSLLTYSESRPWASAIKRRVVSREMPPWGLDRNVGISKIDNDPSLSDAEIATIVSWVDAGAPMGNPADMPRVKEFPDPRIWTNGTPDLIVSMPKEHIVAASGSDETLNFIAETGLTEDRWLKAVETKPGPESFGVVHHVHTDIIEPGTSEMGAPGREFLNEYAVGKNADIFPDNTGRLIKAGSKINFNNHYYSKGEVAKDRTSVGLYFYPKGYTPKYKVLSQHFADNTELDLPAGAIARHDGYTRLIKPAVITSYQPHMHARGKRQCVEAIFPGTTADVSTPRNNPPAQVQTLSCANYDFNWNLVYVYSQDVAPVLPAGTILHVISWHDNTPNKWIPDARNWVGWGQRSIDVMSFAWISYFYIDEADYQERIKVRAQATNN